MPDLVLKYKRGDTGPAFRSCCLNGQTPVDLTTASEVKLLVKGRDGSDLVEHAMVKDDQTDSPGWASYSWAADDLAVAGQYRAEVQVTWADGAVQTFPAEGYVKISVHPDLGG